MPRPKPPGLSPLAALAAFSALAGCVSSADDEEAARALSACRAAEQECRAQCRRDFEADPSAWDYQSCLESCRPDPGAICYY